MYQTFAFSRSVRNVLCLECRHEDVFTTGRLWATVHVTVSRFAVTHYLTITLSLNPNNKL